MLTQKALAGRWGRRADVSCAPVAVDVHAGQNMNGDRFTYASPIARIEAGDAATSDRLHHPADRAWLVRGR
jgi:hypothetical protein